VTVVKSGSRKAQRTPTIASVTVMTENIIHVTAHDGTEQEIQHVREFMEDALEDYDGHGKIVVSDQHIELHELPALDEYTDELADKIVERIND